MTKEKVIPQIRFSGFTDTWEQRKLGDIASDMVAGGDIDKDLILAEGQYPVIANALTGDGIVGYYDKEYRVNAPAVTVTGRGDVGHAKARLVNFTPVVRLLSVKSEHDVFFLENVINTLKIVIESTGVPQLTVPQLAKYEVAFPRQLDEEEHIGAFFKQLDHLITLHQRKYDKLTKVKKAMLEKMFPENGSPYPEIRFKGFTDAWEQREFGDENDLITGYPFESDCFSETGINLIRGMNVKRGYIDLSNDICVKWTSSKGLESYLLKENDIIIQMDGALIGKSYGIIKKKHLPALLVQRVTRARINNEIADSDFMYQTIQRDFLTYISMNKTETAVPHLSLNDIKNFGIMVPTLLEQKMIGSFFANLDRLITLHQRKLEKLKNIKKACLEKMFV